MIKSNKYIQYTCTRIHHTLHTHTHTHTHRVHTQYLTNANKLKCILSNSQFSIPPLMFSHSRINAQMYSGLHINLTCPPTNSNMHFFTPGRDNFKVTNQFLPLPVSSLLQTGTGFIRGISYNPQISGCLLCSHIPLSIPSSHGAEW